MVQGTKGSLWEETAAPPTAWPQLKGELAADIAVVGGGYTGCAAALAAALDRLLDRPEQADAVTDARIFHKAVDWALRYDEFLDPKQVAVARGLLALAAARAELRKLARPINEAHFRPPAVSAAVAAKETA